MDAEGIEPSTCRLRVDVIQARKRMNDGGFSLHVLRSVPISVPILSRLGRHPVRLALLIAAIHGRVECYCVGVLIRLKMDESSPIRPRGSVGEAYGINKAESERRLQRSAGPS